MIETAAIALVAILAGLALGWFVARRDVAGLRAERDQRAEEFRKAIVDLAAATERAKAADGLRGELEAIRSERDAARTELARRETEAAAFEARIAEFKAAKDDMAGRRAVSAKSPARCSARRRGRSSNARMSGSASPRKARGTG